MSRCAHCRVDEGIECVSVRTGNRRLCDLIDPENPSYNPAYIAIAIRESELIAGSPGLIQMAASVTVAAVKHGVDMIARGADATASPEVQAERKAICEACPLYDLSAGRCSRCGCTKMDLKRRWATEGCPDDPPRWVPV